MSIQAPTPGAPRASVSNASPDPVLTGAEAVVNTHRPGTIPEDATIAVDFAELQDSLTEAEQLANTRDKIDLGLWSPADALMALNPDGFPDRAAAMRELQSRRDESAALALPL